VERSGTGDRISWLRNFFCIRPEEIGRIFCISDSLSLGWVVKPFDAPPQLDLFLKKIQIWCGKHDFSNISESDKKILWACLTDQISIKDFTRDDFFRSDFAKFEIKLESSSNRFFDFRKKIGSRETPINSFSPSFHKSAPRLTEYNELY